MRMRFDSIPIPADICLSFAWDEMKICTYETSEPEHDLEICGSTLFQCRTLLTYSYADVLDLLCAIWVSRMRTKAFHPRICGTINKDDKRLDKFCRVRNAGKCFVPCPPIFRENTKKPCECHKTITPENTALCGAS